MQSCKRTTHMIVRASYWVQWSLKRPVRQKTSQNVTYKILCMDSLMAKFGVTAQSFPLRAPAPKLAIGSLPERYVVSSSRRKGADAIA